MFAPSLPSKNKRTLSLCYDGIGYSTYFDYRIWQQQGNSRKNQSTNITPDKIDMMNIINDNTFNLHNSLLNNDNRYMKVTLKSKLIGVARKEISADYREF